MIDTDKSTNQSTESVSELDEKVVLPPEVWEKIQQDAINDLVLSLKVQAIIVIILFVISMLFTNIMASLYVVLGALAYFIPNLLVGTLTWLVVKKGNSSGTLVMLGVFIKLALVALILTSIVVVSNKVIWPALIVGLIVTMKSYLFMIIVKSIRRTD